MKTNYSTINQLGDVCGLGDGGGVKNGAQEASST
jgi:hypothetical protein